MKKFLLLAVSLFISFYILSSCNNSDNATVKTTSETEMSAAEKDSTKREISELIKSFLLQVEMLDIDGAMSFFEKTDDFLAANPDGTSADYNSLKQVNADGLKQMSSFDITLKKEVINILSTTNVLYTAFLNQEFTLKTGEKMKVDNLAMTMLFTRINNSWKITYYHESELPPSKI